MEEKIKEVLTEKVDPILKSHFGGAEFVKIEDGVVSVRMSGACATCPSAQQTVSEVIREIVMENVEGVKDVVLDASVSEDLMDMARKLLRKE